MEERGVDAEVCRGNGKEWEEEDNAIADEDDDDTNEAVRMVLSSILSSSSRTSQSAAELTYGAIPRREVDDGAFTSVEAI